MTGVVYRVYGRRVSQKQYEFLMEARMDVIARLFCLDRQMAKHLVNEVARVSCCELLAGEKGAWQLLGEQSDPLVMIDIRDV